MGKARVGAVLRAGREAAGSALAAQPARGSRSTAAHGPGPQLRSGPLPPSPAQGAAGGERHFPFLPSKNTRTLPTSLSARAGIGPPEGGAAARGTLRTETTQNHNGQIHTDAHPRCSPRRPARNRAATTQRPRTESAKLVLLPVPAPPRFFSPS